MPEGPEVHVAFKQLRSRAAGGTILKSRSLHAKFLVPPEGPIRLIRRHGKWIFIVSGGYVSAINFGMSGRLDISRSRLRPKHTKWEVIYRDEDGVVHALRYVDPRGFGRIRVYSLSSYQGGALLGSYAPSRGVPLIGLGPDVMCRFMVGGDLSVRAARWRRALDTAVPIKRALMDQSRLAGIGNIYASEACRIARVSPWRPARDLTRRELMRMVVGVPAMMVESARRGGTSFGDANTYRDPRGREGGNSALLRVYGRAGQRCSCGGTVLVSREGRTTFYCDSCQSS